MKGEITDVRFWPFALTDKEVKIIFKVKNIRLLMMLAWWWHVKRWMRREK